MQLDVFIIFWFCQCVNSGDLLTNLTGSPLYFIHFVSRSKEFTHQQEQKK